MTLQEILFVMFLFIHIQIAATKPNSSHEALSLLKMLGSSDKTPLVVVIKPNSGTEPSDVYNFLLANDDEKTGKSNDESEVIMEEAKDLLYSYLRSSPYDYDKEIQEKRALERSKTKGSKIPYRCFMVYSCIQKCPRWKSECDKKCKKKYDKEGLCKNK